MAQSRGNLPSTAKQKVTTEDNNIVIQPAQENVVYAPRYDPQ